MFQSNIASYEQQKVNTHEDTKSTGTKGLEEIPFVYKNFGGNFMVSCGCVIYFVCFCGYVMMQSNGVHTLSLYIHMCFLCFDNPRLLKQLVQQVK